MFDKVDKVKGVINSLEEGVMITFTDAPSFISNLTKDADLTSVTFYCDAPTQSATALRVYRLGTDTALIAQSDSIAIKSTNEIKRTVIFPADSIQDPYYKSGKFHLLKDEAYFFVLFQAGDKDLNLEGSNNKGGKFVVPAYNMYRDNNTAILRLNFGTHTGINTVKSNANIDLYPNPTTGLVNISEKASVNIYTISGVKLASYTDVNTFDMSNLSKGTYIVKVKTENTVITKKITLTK